MPQVIVYAVTTTAVQQLKLPFTPASMHDLPEDLPLGVYTAFRTFDHYKFLRLSDHFRRLEQSMALLNWRYALDEAAIRHALHQVCGGYAHPDARVRLDVLARPATQLGSNSRLLLTLAPFNPPPAAVYERGVHLELAPRLQRHEPRVKTADFILARREYPLSEPGAGGDPGPYEYLLLDEEQHLLEGSTSNFYAVRDGSVYTAGDGVLEGITRKTVLELIAEAGIKLQLRAARLVEVEALDEAFLSSSARGLVPVRKIDGRVVGTGQPGPVTRRLMAAYDDFVARSVRPAVALE